MRESAFREILASKMVTDIFVEENYAKKGRPARSKVGLKTVWNIKFCLGEDRVFCLESARGGAREWASLSCLDRWLKEIGIEKYVIQHISNGDPLQPQLSFTEP